MENDKQIATNDFRREEQKLLGQIRMLRSRALQTESQMPLIKQALSQVRDMLNGLVPENVYLRLRDLPEKDLPTNEWILVHVWELVYPFK